MRKRIRRFFLFLSFLITGCEYNNHYDDGGVGPSGNTASCADVRFSSVQPSINPIPMNVGGSRGLAVAVTVVPTRTPPAGCNFPVDWSSDASGIVSVMDGVLYGHAVGTAHIRACVRQQPSVCTNPSITVVVQQPVASAPVQSFTWTNGTDSVRTTIRVGQEAGACGSTRVVVNAGFPTFSPSFIWASSDGTRVAVLNTETGMLRGIAPTGSVGPVTVTVSLRNVTGVPSIKCVVDVIP